MKESLRVFCSQVSCMKFRGLYLIMTLNIIIIIHQTHYEKSDWSRAFNQFTLSFDAFFPFFTLAESPPRDLQITAYK